MARHHLINGIKVAFTAEEETAWDNAETAWNNGAFIKSTGLILDLEEINLLAETDFYALSDVTMSDEMKKYRQDLRDLPAGKDTVEKCKNATFPTKP